MLKAWKSKRQLSLLVALALSVGGGQLFFNHAHAADVTGGDVTVDSGHPAPSPAAGNAHDVPGATDNRNVTGNKLTISGVGFGPVYGGYTLGTGNSTGNEVIVKDGATNNAYAYGGWSANGNATNNTITLTGTASTAWHGNIQYYGGFSNNSSADVRTGNTLKVQSKSHLVHDMFNFEKLQFDLSSGINSGDTMVSVNYAQTGAQTFDWGNIVVTGAADWASGATGSKRVTLYQALASAALTLNNYNPLGTSSESGNFEYGKTTNTTTPGASTVTATQIFFDVNQFKNGDVVYNTSTKPLPASGVVYGGTSTLGRTTTNNKLTLDGVSTVDKVYGGYTQSNTGDANNNEIVMKDGATNNAYAYGGWSANGNAMNNTITLTGTASTAWHTGIQYYGGFSNNPSADVRTGNTLKVQSKSHRVHNMFNFEKLQFDLNSGINSGDEMLFVNYAGTGANTFEWSNIKVSRIADWVAGLPSSVNTPTLKLYQAGPSSLTLNNYSPSLLSTVGDYEFGKSANGTLSGTTMTGVTQIHLNGNKFQNAAETPTTWAADVHAGISTYGNTTNHNTLNISMALANARAGYTKALNGGSEDNTLNLLSGGSITNGYAGYTEGKNLLLHPTDENDPTAVDTTKNADAKNNTVNINGGTLNAGGKLYGGYIAPNAALTPPNNVSAGDAKGNTINIENGTFGGSTEIYGGYTNGTGKATGNTVNLGKSDGTFSASTLNNTFIYGGASSGSASDVMTGNTLNVNTQNITARGVTSFGKTVFNLNSTTVVSQPTPNTLLTIGGGATTGLDWAGVEVNPGSTTFTPSTYEKHLFKAMHNGSGITFSNYAPHGAKEKIVGNLEYIIDTDNHTGTAGQDVYIDGFQFKDHTSAAYSETTSHPEAWAGRTASGQTVTNNKLAFTGNAVNAYGGLVENKKHNSDGTYKTTGDAKKNTLEVTGGTLTNAYGAKVTPKGGSAEENTIKITGGSISGSAYGAEISDAAGTGTGTKNKAEMTGGALTGSLYGARTAGSGALSASEVKITGGTIGGSVYGSAVAAGAGSATGSEIKLEGGSVGGNVYGGHTASGATTGNKVNLGNGTTNAVTTVTGTIYGGNQAADTDNVLNVNTNATAGNIANFGMVNFNFNSTFNQANPMLNLVGGTATNFDWNKFAIDGNAPSGTSVLMQNLSNINVANYHGAKEISSTGTHEYTIDTDTNAATAKQILFGGYQFKDANVTPTTSDTAKDVWAGRSVIGNTTTNNNLTINGTSHRDAYGGWTAGTGTTAPAKFNSTSNTVNLKAGSSVRNIYGGFTSVQSGNATGNKVNISGGTVSGIVHGGYLSHATATGDATGNTVTITGGTMGDVYGGFTAGTGATTGNTVNLGSEADAVASGTTIGTIYGGNKATATDNTLNVYDSATARNIANFDKINFKATSTHITVGDTLLTLTTGATNFDWTKLHVDNLDNLNSSATSDRILTLMHNSNNINLSNYTPTGTRGRIHTNDYEADITTDGNLATTQNVYLKGYRFQNNTTNYAGGTATDAWGGRSIIGNKVQKNKLTLTGGSATLNARGGLAENTTVPGTTGDAEKNKLILNTGAQTANAYGAEVRTKTGSATKNEVTINAGTVHGNVYGAALTHAAATGSATDNTVTFAGGSVAGNVYGGYTNGSGNTTGNTVNLGDGTHSITAGSAIGGTIYGGNKATDTGNTLNVNTNATAGNIGNFENLKFNINSNALNPAHPMLTLNAGTATNNLDWGKLTVDATNFNSPISTYEAYNLKLMQNTAGISFTKNSVNTYTANGGIKSVNSGNFEFSIDTLGSSVNTTEVRAAGYQYKNHTGATYTAGDGTHAAAWAGRTAVGNKVENNKLTVTGGSITAAAYGGLVENHKLDAHGNPLPTGDAEKNTVAVAGGTVANAYGAEVRTKNGNATENTAEITNGTVGSVYGASLAAAGATGTANKSKVNITGGTINGSVYGGHIANAAATGQITNSEVNIAGGSISGTIYGGYNSGSGDAKSGTVNITAGSMGNVYGGYTVGTGASTGNTVNLGTATTAFAATSVGTIYGGNKSTVTDNTLNVNSRNARAADIKHFENVNFDVAHNVSHGDTMLTLTNGAGTTIDWSKMQLKNLDTITASPTENRILTLLNSTNDVTFTNYDPVRASETKRDGDYEYVLDKDPVNPNKRVDVIGYRFRNNQPTYSTGSNAEAWGGRTKVGNTVENNTLKITGGTITAAAHGGLAENTKAGSGSDGYDPSGDASTNKLILEGGTIADGYGATVRTEAGNATQNTVDLKGTTVTGSLYGGALRHAAAHGAATRNNVNLYSGSVAGNVYGGFATHNGTTTGNTITIGDGTNDATVTVTGKLIGGNKAATDNVLNIKSKGAQAGTLENFGKITFNLGANVADGDTVLTLNQNTALAYNTIEKPTGTSVSTWLGNVMEKNVHLFQMAAGKKLTLSGYNPATGSERAEDVEYSLVTNNNQDVTTAGGSLDLSAYKWKNANVEINSGAHADVFGGKTVYGTTGETKTNTLTLKAGASVTNAIGGDTQTTSGTAEENTLKVEAGTAVNALGAKTKHGKALQNKAILTGGSVTGKLVGAQSTDGAAEKNRAEVRGGSTANAYGAETLVGDAAENSAVITAGSVTGTLKGAQSAGKAVKNSVEIAGGSISGAKVMGAEAAGNAERNTVTITATPTANASTEIIGGRSTGGDAIENVVNVNASITGDVYGGRAHNASLRNIVNIADGVTVTGSVFGGACVIAEGNQVYVGRGSTVTGNVTGGSAPTSDGNTIHLTGSTVGGNVIGGTGLAANGNTLAIHHDTAHPTSHINDFTGIKKLHFYLSEGIENENPTLLQLGVSHKDIANIDVGLGVHGRARALKVNDVISLMKVAGSGTLDNIPTDNKVTGMQGVSLLYEFAFQRRNTDELIATVTKAAISDQTKSFVETRAAATDFINRGADLLAGPGITAARHEAKGGAREDNEVRGYHLWASMQQGNMRTETGSYADTKGYNLSLGWARELKGKTATLTFTPFVEYGKGTYNSYLDDGTHGSGNVSYLGAGIMGRMENNKGLWAEAALHGGKARSDYKGSVYTGSTSSYDSANAYYAAHLGIGKEIKTNDKDKMNAYLRYFWSYQSGMQAGIHSTGSSMSTDDYDFSGVHSNRVRLGFTYTHQDSDKSEVYAGLAWEYELSGKAGATYQGYDAPSPSLRGGSAMLEAGYRFAPKDSRFSYDLRFTGWQGKRHGYTGGAHVNWAF